MGKWYMDDWLTIAAGHAHVREDPVGREAGVRHRLGAHAPQQVRVCVQQLQACARTAQQTLT